MVVLESNGFPYLLLYGLTQPPEASLEGYEVCLDGVEFFGQFTMGH
jgi:hypothetical protein